jgi:hypothetical protein
VFPPWLSADSRSFIYPATTRNLGSGKTSRLDFRSNLPREAKISFQSTKLPAPRCLGHRQDEIARGTVNFREFEDASIQSTCSSLSRSPNTVESRRRAMGSRVGEIIWTLSLNHRRAYVYRTRYELVPILQRLSRETKKGRASESPWRPGKSRSSIDVVS